MGITEEREMVDRLPIFPVPLSVADATFSAVLTARAWRDGSWKSVEAPQRCKRCAMAGGWHCGATSRTEWPRRIKANHTKRKVGELGDRRPTVCLPLRLSPCLRLIMSATIRDPFRSSEKVMVRCFNDGLPVCGTSPLDKFWPLSNSNKTTAGLFPTACA